MKLTFLFLLLSVSSNASATTTGSPVEKVVQLLKDLKTKIGNDGKEEQQIYDKYACWCEKTTKRKAAAIEEAQMELRALGQQILKLKGRIATLTAEIAELTEAIRKNEEAQAEATTIRQKENAQFVAETDEMKQALAALEKAIIVLRDATKAKPQQPTALLQRDTAAEGWSRAVAGVNAAIHALPVRAPLSSKQVSLLTEFVSGSDSYAPQSATVQGILKDMYDTFSSDLEAAMQEEASKNRVFEDFIATKQKELIELKATKAKKEAEKSEAEAQLAETTQAYDDTEAQMKADIEFFDLTKAACQAKLEEWTDRKNLRNEELEGIIKAIEILTSDEAREMFSKSIKPGVETGFFQLEQDQLTSAPMRAFSILKASATRAHSLRLASLAAEVRTAKTGHFEPVIAAIEKMIQTLKDEEAADIAKRDQCKDEYQNIASTVADLNWKIEKNEAKIDKLEQLIALREAEKAKTIEDIKVVITQIGEMENVRQEENRAFLQAKSDDEQAIDLLEQAKDALISYFKKNDVALGPVQGSVKGLEFAQQPEFQISEDQAPDATFSHKGKRKNESKGIVQIMTMLIEDLQDEIKNGIKDEEAAQLDFESRLAAAKKLQKELEEKKVNLEMTIAKRQSEKDDEHADMDVNKKDLSDEVAYKKDITNDCDWIIRAFEERRTRRAAEMDGLVGAKEFLAGYQGSTGEVSAF
jgi:predicted  nucleic acid-binding Zn-ribbon protein